MITDGTDTKQTLTGSQVDGLGLTGWAFVLGRLHTRITCADFAAALRIVDAIGEAAEAADHHPDIHLHSWNRVRLKLSTHSEHRVTEKDHALAARIDALAP
jgi:4a-hydroxytetrahydrobiopterin dehydratase